MNTKNSNILYWTFTILFAGFMIWSSIPGIKPEAKSIQFLHDFLGYPIYFIQFISVAKLAGAVVILIPGLYKIKEWAYAGLFFDLAGAIYSVIAASGKLEPGTLFILLPVALGILSYIFWNRKRSS
jgi:hypothetical protein